VSWWTIEARDKAVDRNDNDAGLVVFTRRSAVRTAVVAMAGDTLETVDGEVNRMLDLLDRGGRVSYAARRL
jgi:hypothetical protein